MIVRQRVYAPAAVRQLIYKFNVQNSTFIEQKTEYLDGTSFSIINFKDTEPSLIFDFAYKLGGIQEYLSKVNQSWLPIADYPFPPSEK
ncbi:hypothetical protein [Flavobacterium sp. N502540]|uniref:hypothetical protein n=1 Tax=Flavobacterium sp. N502540 TaxID=2986838 RepID=UPI0022254011|nr:hypothetical protein [Flavobacterium sp. N502540]